MQIEKLTKENFPKIQELYKHFERKAQTDFLFEIPPLEFQDFQHNFNSNFIKGFVNTNGFILYTDTLNEAIEITLIFTKNSADKTTKIELLTHFLNEIKKEYSNKIISYPMLGIQNEINKEAISLGFTPIGEAILEFNFHNVISQVILQKCNATQIQENYSVDIWQDIYLKDAINTIYNEFKNSNDAKFDPRFQTKNGIQNILESITQNYYGNFNPYYVSVLKHNYTPVGYCFVNFTTDNIANIPLLVIDKEHQHKGYASALLINSIEKINNKMNSENIIIDSINVTCDTENYSAIKTYRKVGFKEKTYYTHLYMEI